MGERLLGRPVGRMRPAVKRTTVTLARAMARDGRPVDGRPVLPGDSFTTTSRRTTSPYPSQKAEKFASRWLIDNAATEASARGDEFNGRCFKATPVLRGGELAPVDRASMLEYLFGDQPAVCPSPLKALTA